WRTSNSSEPACGSAPNPPPRTSPSITASRPPWRSRTRSPPWSRGPSPLGVQDGVADRLHPDQAVAEHEGVDAVIDPGRPGVRGPLKEEHVAFEDQRLQVPGRVRHIGKQLSERLPDAVLAALDASRRDKHSVVGVVGDDSIQVPPAKGLGVVLEDFLGRARHRVPPWLRIFVPSLRVPTVHGTEPPPPGIRARYVEAEADADEGALVGVDAGGDGDDA